VFGFGLPGMVFFQKKKGDWGKKIIRIKILLSSYMLEFRSEKLNEWNGIPSKLKVYRETGDFICIFFFKKKGAGKGRFAAVLLRQAGLSGSWVLAHSLPLTAATHSLVSTHSLIKQTHPSFLALSSVITVKA
jgi:hypothetical protein